MDELKISPSMKVLSASVCLLVLCFFIFLAAHANSDLAVGRYVLFMDERITFDGVKAILHADSIKAFVNALALGDQRYGRSLWISISTFSFIREWIWGDAGQIIAARMSQVGLIVVASGIWVVGILRNWYLRLVLILGLLSMPFSDYYMSMPKPEPLQLLFLSLFCYFFIRKGLKFGWYWLFLGLSFGTKISTLPAVLVFLVCAAIVGRKSVTDKAPGYSLKSAGAGFVIGLCIAVPILCLPVLLSAIFYYLWTVLKRRFLITRIARCLFIVSGIVVTAYLSRRVLHVWIGSTFLNTAHDADQKSINFYSWVIYFYKEWLIAPPILGVGLTLLAGLSVGASALFWRKAGVLSGERAAAVSIVMAGIALNLAIFLGVHRLWGFYLYPGTFLAMAGLVFIVDLLLSARAERTATTTPAGLKILAYAVVTYLFCISAYYWAPVTVDSLRSLAMRTHDPVYAEQYASYQQTVQFLEKLHAEKGRTLKVQFTPGLFPPDSNAKYSIIEFWGPYTDWDNTPDAIVFSAVHTAKAVAPKEDSPDYGRFLAEREGYALHVADVGGRCKALPCFERSVLLPLGGEILTLKQ